MVPLGFLAKSLWISYTLKYPSLKMRVFRQLDGTSAAAFMFRRRVCVVFEHWGNPKHTEGHVFFC